jgi:hypothetical protein
MQRLSVLPPLWNQKAASLHIGFCYVRNATDETSALARFFSAKLGNRAGGLRPLLSRQRPSFTPRLPSICLLHVWRRQNSSSSPVAIGIAFTTLAITSAGYFSPLCPLGIGDHLWVSRADFAFADFSIGTKDDPPPHLIKFCTRHDFCVLRIAPAAFLPSPLVKHSAPPMLLPPSIWERARANDRAPTAITFKLKRYALVSAVRSSPTGPGTMGKRSALCAISRWDGLAP